jgi:uroporphyrinogen-III synthase
VTAWRLLLTRPADDSRRWRGVGRRRIFSSSLPLAGHRAAAGLDKIRRALAHLGGLQRGHRGQQAGGAPALELDAMAGSLSMPWFSVGAATAQILAITASTSLSADGDDSEALLQLPRCARRCTPDARVLILRGEGGRELLAERLREQGASVDYLELYRRDLPAYTRMYCHDASKRNA